MSSRPQRAQHSTGWTGCAGAPKEREDFRDCPRQDKVRTWFATGSHLQTGGVSFLSTVLTADRSSSLGKLLGTCKAGEPASSGSGRGRGERCGLVTPLHSWNGCTLLKSPTDSFSSTSDCGIITNMTHSEQFQPITT